MINVADNVNSLIGVSSLQFSDETALFTLVNEAGNEVGAGVRGLLLYDNGTVCDDGFDDNAANAICTEMGYEGVDIWTSGLNSGFQREYEIKMNDVHCRNGSWASCEFVTYQYHDCGHSEDVFLVCREGEHNPSIFYSN